MNGANRAPQITARHVIRSVRLRAEGRGWVCTLRIGVQDYPFTFADLVEFSAGVAQVLLQAEHLHAPHLLAPADRTYVQIETVHIEDAAEHNKRAIAWREVEARRADGAHLAGGRWYMELAVNGADNDCSFSTTVELLQCLQSIIAREMAQHGEVAHA